MPIRACDSWSYKFQAPTSEDLIVILSEVKDLRKFQQLPNNNLRCFVPFNMTQLPSRSCLLSGELNARDEKS
jgi:hypothetical protein